jgi:hypothetical protein
MIFWDGICTGNNGVQAAIVDFDHSYLENYGYWVVFPGYNSHARDG